MKQVESDVLIHMPDLSFVKYCEKEYGVNRGIYNTIDQWFFEQGVHRIIERRKNIMQFLDSVELLQNDKGKVKFGSKGLTERLNGFVAGEMGMAQ